MEQNTTQVYDLEGRDTESATSGQNNRFDCLTRQLDADGFNYFCTA